MNDSKANKITALKKLGVPRKDIEDFRKSSREYFAQYRGKEGQHILTPELIEKTKQLIDIRKESGIEIVGAIYENNLTVKFLFYVNGNPEDAYVEENVFPNVSVYLEELDRQISPNFVPVMTGEPHVFCKYNEETEIYLMK